MQGDSEALLRVFIDQAPVPIALFDRDMCYIAASRRWTSDYGFAHKTWRGVSHYELFPDLPERWHLAHRRAQNGEVVAHTDDRYDRADGSVQWLRWEVRPWYREEQQRGIIIFAEDIFSAEACRFAVSPFDQLVSATKIEEYSHEDHR